MEAVALSLQSPPRRGGVAEGRGGQFGEIQGLPDLTTPSAPLRWLRGIFLMAQPPLLCEEARRGICEHS